MYKVEPDLTRDTNDEPKRVLILINLELRVSQRT